jgi:hypothetical protein
MQDETRFGQSQAGAAEFLRDEYAEPAGRGKRPHELPRVAFGTIVLQPVVERKLRGERAGLALNGLL